MAIGISSVACKNGGSRPSALVGKWEGGYGACYKDCPLTLLCSLFSVI